MEEKSGAATPATVGAEGSPDAIVAPADTPNDDAGCNGFQGGDKPNEHLEPEASGSPVPEAVAEATDSLPSAPEAASSPPIADEPARSTSSPGGEAAPEATSEALPHPGSKVASGESAAAEGVVLGPPPPPASAPWEQRRIWRPRSNKHAEETDADSSWYAHRRHLLIYSYSGKPVYTRYGSEDGISGTTGALAAIVSKFQSFFFNDQSGSQDSLRYMIAGDTTFAFVERGPLWLMCISRCGDTYHDMVRLLDRVHMQIITILTSGIERTLKANPSYDMRSLLGGTDPVVNSMVRWCTQDMYLQVDAFEPLPLPPAVRSLATESLRAARLSNVLCGLLLAAHRVISIVTSRQYKLHALDLMMVINLIQSSSSLRTSESWTPVCLTRLSDKAFAYAYISFIEDSDVGVVFLSTASDGEQFYGISQHAAGIKRTLARSGCLGSIAEATARCPVELQAGADESRWRSMLASTPGHLRLLDGILHAAYYMPSSQQLFSSAIAPAYRTRRRTKLLFRMYGRCRLLLRSAKQPAQICIATEYECFYVSVAAEFHVYLAVPRGISTGVIGQMYQWIRCQESHIFIGSVPTW